MINYQSTPDYYRDYIEHGWFSDTTKKAHKYIDKYMNKAGKWVYVYKTKAKTAMNNYKQEKEEKTKRKQLKNWIEKGVYKSYKKRKTKIANARQNVYEEASKNPKVAYARRKKQVSQARQNAKEKWEQYAKNARSSYNDRKAYVRDSRGRTRHNNALKKQGYVYYNGKKVYK